MKEEKQRNKKKGLTLAIETAVGGGSLALLESGLILDRWIGETEVSRSEDLIEAVSQMLKRNRLKASALNLLAVSRGPGSYTGARIGLATAIGISNGLNVECFGVSLMDCFFYKFGDRDQLVVTAVSFGRNEICYRIFENLKIRNKIDDLSQNRELVRDQEPKVVNFQEFVQLFGDKFEALFILDHKLYAAFKDFGFTKNSNLINAGLNLADIVGQFVGTNKLDAGIMPIYPRN